MADTDVPATTTADSSVAVEESAMDEERPVKRAKIESENDGQVEPTNATEEKPTNANDEKPANATEEKPASATEENVAETEAPPSSAQEEKIDGSQGDSKEEEQKKESSSSKSKARGERRRNESPRASGATINIPYADDGKDPRTEKDVGITAFVNRHRGFHGVIKQRFSDFLVREIDLDRRVVQLTDMSLPALPERESTPVPEVAIPEETLKALKELDEGATKSEKGIEIDVTKNSKEERKGIHFMINKTYATLISTTKLKENKTLIVVAKRNSKSQGRRSGFRWPVVIDGVDNYYTTFAMYKENKETQECIYDLAYKLRFEPTKFSFAGTKDRRAKTTQSVSVFRVAPEAVLEAAKQVRGVEVGNFKFTPERVELGALKGNKFSIVLRNLVCADSELDEIMGNLQNEGFINYYGMQRFGTHKMGTHEVGREMLRGNWEEAVEFILRPRERDDHDMQRARRVWQTRKDATEAFRCLRSRSRTIEGKLWLGLSRNKGNFKKAVEALPRNLRLLYLHAYQSYIWNQVASRRYEKHGKTVLPGDLVLAVDDFDIEEDELIENENFNDEDEGNDKKEEREKRRTSETEEERPSKKQAVTETENVEEGTEKKAEGADEVKMEADDQTVEAKEQAEPKEKQAEEGKMETDDQTVETKEQAETVQEEKKDTAPAPTEAPVEAKAEPVLTAEEERRKKLRQVPVIVTEETVKNYTIYDVVLPLPGGENIYPENECAEWYREFLAKDGVEADSIQKEARSYCLYGGYRRFIQRPIDLTYRKMRYNDVTLPLIASDMDIIHKLVPKEVPDGRFEALIMEFSLPASSYATMALREAMKTETSAQHQASLNDYYKKFVEDY